MAQDDDVAASIGLNAAFDPGKFPVGQQFAPTAQLKALCVLQGGNSIVSIAMGLH
jgi:hypothetical protein